jgi:ammonium transporter Rh
MARNTKVMALALALGMVLMGLLAVIVIQPFEAATGLSGDDSYLLNEAFKFIKSVGIWFMLMLVAFLMLFIKKFEWGVCLAVLLSAASSFIVYAGIQEFYFGYEWNNDLMVRGAIAAITYVIAIGVFLGTVKQWHYFLGGIAFAVVYALVEWIVCNFELFGTLTTDPGGSIMVHMCAAYFGLGVCLALKIKEAFNEPMYTTTHSVSFVWLASMLLWVLWPTFVCGLLDMEDFALGTATCYMAGLGSIVSAYAVCMICQKKVNPLTYTYAMLAGPVAIGAPLLSVSPWGALVIGLVAGAISAACFIYLQPWLCGKLGVLDVMGVHNLHGMAGWTGAIACAVVLFISGNMDGGLANIVMAAIVFAISLVGGAITGVIIRLTKGKPMEMFSDDYDFIKNEAPQQ